MQILPREIGREHAAIKQQLQRQGGAVQINHVSLGWLDPKWEENVC